MIERLRTRGDTGLYWTVTVLFCIALAWAILPEGLRFGVGAHQPVGARQGSVIRRLQWIPVFMLGAYIVWVRRHVAWAMVRHVNPFLAAFFCWAAASQLWSPYPEITLRKSVLFAGVVVIALAFQVAGWERDRMVRLLCWMLTMLLAVSFLTALFLPDIGRDAPPGAQWVGVTESKNHLGQLAGLALLLWLIAVAARQVRWWLALPAIALSAGLLLLSQSASALACCLPLVPVVWFMLRPPLVTRHGHGLLIAVLAVVAGIVGLAFMLLVLGDVPGWHELVRPVADVLGRDVTLTGRLEIWHRVLVEVGKHPWLGHGFGAFWLGAGGPAPWVTQNLYGILWQAHNGYLDVLNETGIVGLVLALAFVLFHLGQVRMLAPYDRANAAAHLAIMGFFVVNNLTESSIFRPINFLFFVSVMASLSLSRAHADIALRRAALYRERVRAPTA